MKNNVLSELNRASSEMIQLVRRRGETRHARSSRAFGQTASERIANDQPEEICHSLKSWSKRWSIVQKYWSEKSLFLFLFVGELWSIHVWRLRQETTHWTNERLRKVCSSLSNVEKAFDVDLGDAGAEWNHRSLPGDCSRTFVKWSQKTLEKHVHKGYLAEV